MGPIRSFLLRASLPFRKFAGHAWLTFCNIDMEGLLVGGGFLFGSVVFEGLAIMAVRVFFFPKIPSHPAPPISPAFVWGLWGFAGLAVVASLGCFFSLMHFDAQRQKPELFGELSQRDRALRERLRLGKVIPGITGKSTPPRPRL